MTKIGTALSIAALAMAMAVAAPGQESTNTGTAAVSIEIVGGFGHLTSMELRATRSRKQGVPESGSPGASP